MASPDPESLRALARAARARDPKARQRELAASIGVSEGELVAAHVGTPGEGLALVGPQARRLRSDWPAMIGALEPVGDVMALTRNEACVHEKIGTYRETSHGGTMGLVLGGAIDLRLFYGRWAHGYALREPGADGPRESLQFYDASGLALHKIHRRPETDGAAWQRLIDDFTAEDQQPGLAVAPAPAAALPAESVDAEAFLDDWAAMRDTHEFFALLRRHGVTRTQALRLAEPRFARRLGADCARPLLDAAAAGGLPIMVFVGNPGIIQIHTGPVQRVLPMGPWLNVMDPGFNLHLRMDLVTEAWAVEKPTDDGRVTSVELFDAAGSTIAMFFGERKPGREERGDWRELVATLSGASACTA